MKDKLVQRFESSTRPVCFDIDKRGNNGETLLHICFTNGSFIHMLVMKSMLHAFPKLINDICLADEYYGSFCCTVYFPYLLIDYFNNKKNRPKCFAHGDCKRGHDDCQVLAQVGREYSSAMRGPVFFAR